MEKYNQIFNSIFKQSLFDESSKALIEKAAQEYPYFSPAQLFLLHLTNKNSNAYAEQAKKTSLLFNNNYWLNFQMLELSRLEKEFTTTNEIFLEPSTVLPEEAVIKLESENNESIIAGNLLQMALENESVTTSSINLNELPVIEQVTTSEDTTLIEETSIEATIENLPVMTEVTAGSYGDIPESHTEQIEAYVEAEVIKQTEYTQEESLKKEQPAGETQNEDELPVDEDELPVDGDDLPVDDEMKQVSLKIAETLSAIAVESNSTKDTISFEPLHTSDYFASVGIRLSEEIKPSDKLGLQMKSFTQWLKTMKKLHTDQLRETGSTDNQLNVQNEQSIQQLAEASNKENIVVTEAMAEVLLQQGKIMKAIEVYEKLSLLDPFKKAYFAAKLKQLKG